ncbi:hypothetical protein GGI13_006120 [Coemansia sp. RSA 455]|nr:hypothetical protein GGI13_006120 [Coemansia sp. RSA 455]
MDKPTNYKPSASATKPQNQAIHLDGPVVLSHAEIIAKQLELYAKRLRFNAKQLELDEQQRKLDDEQRELNGQSSVSVAFKLMVSASTCTPAFPVIDAPTEDSTLEQLLAPNTAMPAESTSPCPPIAALPSLLVAALPAARPTAAQEGKRPAPTNESAESPIAPKRHRGDGQISNNGATSGSSLTNCRSLSEQVAIERLVAALDIPALVAPAAGASTFGNAPAIDISAADISAYFAPAAGALAGDYSAFAADAPTFGNAPAAGALAGDNSAFAAPTAGALAGDYSAFATPAAGALAADSSAYVAPVDAAQFAAILNADQPIDRHLATQEWVHRATRNDASESSQVVKRHRLDMCVSDSVTATNSSCMIYDDSGMVYDASGEQVTSERLLVVLGEASFVGLGYVQAVYRYIYGCELMPSTAPPQERIAMLASVVALEHWAPQLGGHSPAHIADLRILCRRDLELGALRQSFREQLGLAEDQSAAVLGPRLCYVVVRMCAMSVDLLTGPMLRSMFVEVTGLDLHSLNVATEQGVRQMEANSIFQMLKNWADGIIKFIADDGNGLEDVLAMVTDCNALFETRCDSASSSDASIALYMLRNNELYSTLFLGNRDAKWEALCRRLIFVSGKNTSSYAKECLEHLSTSLQIQPGS